MSLFIGFAQQEDTTTLVQRLENLQSEYEVNFLYNHTLLDKLTLPQTKNCSSLQECLEEIGKNIPLKFEKNGARSYMILPIRENISFRVEDKDSNEDLHEISYQINEEFPQFIYPKESIYTIKNVFLLDSVYIHSSFYKSIAFKAIDLLNSTKTIRMEHRTIHLNEVEISDYLTRGINTKISDNTIQVNMQSLGLLAGKTDGDIFNVVKNIPGVHTPSGKPGSLNFRGSTFDRSLIQIDDIPIYHNGHFYGALAPYNPTMINNIEIQRNTLSAKWGGRVGGLINMTTDNTVPDSTSYSIQANTIYGGVTIKAPLIKDKLAFFIAGRSNYPGISSPKLRAYSNLNFQGSRLKSVTDEVNSENFEVGFYDINSKLIYHINDKHKATISYINIINRLSATLRDYEDDNQKDFRDLNLDNWGMTAKWEGDFSEKVNTQVRFSKSSLKIDNISEGFSGTERNSFEKYMNTIDDTRLITELNYTATPTTKIETGYTLTDYKIRFDERNDQNSIDSRRNQDAINHSLFFTVNKNWNDRVTTNIGLHSDYFQPNQKIYLDPRISINVKANEALYFKSALGRAHQFIQKKLRDDFDDFNDDSQFWFLPDQTTAALEGRQAMVGALYNTSGWLADIEFYIRKTDNITLQTSTDALEKGELKSLGVDLFVKKRWNKLETMASYSLSQVDTDFSETLPVFFDQRHILNLTALWHLNAFDIAATWSLATGMPVIIPELEDNEGATFDGADIPYSNRFPSQHQLDISGTYTFTNTKKNWKGVIGLSFVNLYDRDNVVNIFQNEPLAEDPYRNAIGFAPNLQIGIHF